MLNLEQAIGEWRNRMAASGIQSPKLLDELEAHLREEIERQLKSGADVQTALQNAVAQIGDARVLKREFRRAGGFTCWLAEKRFRVLGALWLAFCVASIARLAGPVFDAFADISHLGVNAPLLLMLVLAFIYLRAGVGSFLLVLGNLRERRFVRFLAALDLICGSAAILARPPQRPITFILTLFGLVSIWLLRPPKSEDLQPA